MGERDCWKFRSQDLKRKSRVVWDLRSGCSLVLNLVARLRREAARWDQTPFFSLQGDLGRRGRFQLVDPVPLRLFQALL